MVIPMRLHSPTKHRNLFRVIDFVAEQAGHEFDRIIRFQIRRLITDERRRRRCGSC